MSEEDPDPQNTFDASFTRASDLRRRVKRRQLLGGGLELVDRDNPRRYIKASNPWRIEP